PSLTTVADARGAFAFAAPPHEDIELRVRCEGTLFSFRDAADIRFPEPIVDPLRIAIDGEDPRDVRVIDKTDPGRELAVDEAGALARKVFNRALLWAVPPSRVSIALGRARTATQRVALDVAAVPRLSADEWREQDTLVGRGARLRARLCRGD